MIFESFVLGLLGGIWGSLIVISIYLSRILDVLFTLRALGLIKETRDAI